MKRGRPKRNFDQIPGRFPEGTIDRIDSVREGGETRTAFLQTAVEGEIARRSHPRRSAETLDAPDEG
ncbi:hypothetical protein HFO56_33370 [Rhizobium laguerreae]|uniref:YlcI/YnfO family protein n=1 Tax=Rhizobium laguerreae TaxID=1076926 RepID=UPI001C929D6E|nr:YlcI/YnfO family protein [Rhizobium laguerreae]MBY3157217.1 hypothetical protein [Rhizobium laguerreae]